MTQLTLHNREATMAVGKKMAPFLQAGDVIVLNGDLGAGKTTFTKGLAAGLGISDVIKSPTLRLFVNINQDACRFTIWISIDLRMAGPKT